jgi:hypothetical protein
MGTQKKGKLILIGGIKESFMKDHRPALVDQFQQNRDGRSSKYSLSGSFFYKSI